MKPGLYLANKPVGVTSFSVVRAFQAEIAAVPGRKFAVCHGGTLDPFAEGLLLVLAGAATRLMDFHHPVPKHYEAEVVWGTETDTGDPGGREVFQGDARALTPDALASVLSTFVGWHDQVPPATCAKKIGGEPAYKKVHRGESVVLSACRVYLHEAGWRAHDLPRASRLSLSCRGGFYVRALVRELGRALGCGAHLRRLRRTRIGPFDDPGPDRRVWVGGDQMLPWAAARVLTDDELGRLRREQPISRGRLAPPAWAPPPGFPDPAAPVRAFHRDRLVALLREEGSGLRLAVLLPGGL